MFVCLFVFSALCVVVVLMLCAPEPEKKKKAPLESENQSERLSDFTILSLSAKQPAHLFPPTVPSALHTLFLLLPLWKEDGTVHSASCTRTKVVTDRLAAGILNSSCRVTPGFCCCSSVWCWSGSAGSTKVGKSDGPRRRRRTSSASKCVRPALHLIVIDYMMCEL